MPPHEFHNPYHFVPVKKAADSGPLRRMDKKFEDLRFASSTARHDIGRIGAPGRLGDLGG